MFQILANMFHEVWQVDYVDEISQQLASTLPEKLVHVRVICSPLGTAVTSASEKLCAASRASASAVIARMPRARSCAPARHPRAGYICFVSRGLA